MRKTIAIGLAALLLAVAVPTAAHVEERPDACSKGKDTCQPRGNHAACTGTRDWFDAGGDSLSLIGVTLGQGDEETGVYVHTSPSASQEQGDPESALGPRMPGVLWLETNGFSGFQKADWYCKSAEHGTDESVQHSDQVII